MKLLTGKPLRLDFARLTSLLQVIGVVTFLLSMASRYDDDIQQEFFRTKSTHVVFRRLPSANHGIRRRKVVTQIATPDNKSPMPEWFGCITRAKLIVRLTPLCSTLVPRSPPLL